MSDPTAAVTHVPAGSTTSADPTPGMVRQVAVATAGMWAGEARPEPGSVSGWHHHGDYESAIYVVSGELRFEYGPGGAQACDAGAGDFVHVPAGVVHRESNVSDEPSHVVVVRAGHGETTVNVDGPSPAP